VLGVGPSGEVLAHLTPRRPVELALDLGCGCGLQSLLCARHARRVIATDINPRAATMTRLNAGSNQIANVEVRRGDLFQPVDGMKFDLVVSNPPYVVSPDKTFIYRDGPKTEGGICRKIIQELPVYLREGGMAVVQCQWGVRTGESWVDAPLRWTEGLGLDLWLIGHGLVETRDYAAAWLKPAAAAQSASHADLRRWQRWYRRQGIRKVATGVFIMRLRKGRNWQRAVVADRKPAGPCGDQVERIFHAQDELTGETAGLDVQQDCFVLAPGSFIPREESDPAPLILRAWPDIGWSAPIAPESLAVLSQCDGQRTLAQAIEAVGAAAGSRSELLTEFQQLYGAGFIMRRADELASSTDGAQAPPKVQ
jgi:SAM-dependent methyltransferase